jgi:hypothetical protein
MPPTLQLCIAGDLVARLAQEVQAAPRHNTVAGTVAVGVGIGFGSVVVTPHTWCFGPSGAPTQAYDTSRHGASTGDGRGLRGMGDGASFGGGSASSAGGTARLGIPTIDFSVPGRAGNGSSAGVVNFASDAARVVPPALLNESSIGEHATLVAALNDSRRGAEEGGERRKIFSAEQLVHGVRAIVSSGVGTYAGGSGARNGKSAASISAAQTVDRGYLTALDIASSLLLMATNNGAGGAGGIPDRPSCRSQTLGSLHHLAEQYRSHIIATVNRTGSSLSFGECGSDGFADYVTSFVDLELGQVSSTGATSGAAVSPWRRIYHCLRCGDLAAALATLDRMPTRSNGLDGAADAATAAAAVKFLSTFQGSKRSIWLAAAEASEAGYDGIEELLSSVPPDVRTAVTELRHAAMVTSTGVGDSAYHTACLSLLCLGSTPPMNDAGADAAGGNGASSAASTVEDYLYEGLWGAFFQQNNDASVAAISSLGEAVWHFGPSHFEDGEDVHGGRSIYIASRTPLAIANETPLSGGWAFAIPLMICQQFESALTYLAKAGGPAGLLQATHLALVLYLGGMDLVDLRPPPSSASPGGSILLTSLLSSYSSTLSKVAAALEYLVLIPDSGPHGGPTCTSSIGTVSGTAKACVQSLIVESGAFEDLAGVMGPDGYRICPAGRSSNAPGLLDAHFSQTEISDLLCAASNEALRRGNGRDAAELLSLAGRYTALLTLLNAELASLLVVEDPDDEEKRLFWRTVGDNFHSIHLRGGPNHVLASLEADNRMDLASTFALIMNLMVFFDRCQSRDWEGAWSLIDEIGLFPSEEDAMRRKVANYQALDAALKAKPFRCAVVCAMESLYQHHSALKGHLGCSQASQEAINQRLGDLCKRARLLVTFAGLCRLEGDVSAKIARMEAHMV